MHRHGFLTLFFLPLFVKVVIKKKTKTLQREFKSWEFGKEKANHRYFRDLTDCLPINPI